MRLQNLLAPLLGMVTVNIGLLVLALLPWADLPTKSAFWMTDMSGARLT